MRILVISFYFPPDLCAGSFRVGALVQALANELGANDAIDVITTFPNRYASYDMDALARERHGITTITRISIPSHRSGMLDQSLAYSRFALGAWREIKSKQYDVVFATTSRLMTGLLGAMVARRIGARLYLDIRDIFVDTVEGLFAGRPMRGMLPVFRWIERYTVRSASRINLVSEGFRSYYEKLADSHKLSFFPNGIDEEFLVYDFRKKYHDGVPLILYAGNIGAGQGLHKIVPQVATRLRNECRFLIIGDGGMRRELEEDLRKEGVENVQVIDPVPRSRLLELYVQADYLFLHLNDWEAFRKVLPSKIFEYAATGKPILAGVAGYPKAFILENVGHAAVFDPCNVEEFIHAFHGLSPHTVNRDRFVKKFQRKAVMQAFAKDILQL